MYLRQFLGFETCDALNEAHIGQPHQYLELCRHSFTQDKPSCE